MKLKSKLIATIVSICAAIAVMGVGVWAATNTFSVTVTNQINLAFANLPGTVTIKGMASANRKLPAELDKEVRESLKNTANVEAASFVGKVVAERAVKSGVSEVVFDRGGYIYHGRVKALADAARSAGLKF